MNKTQKIQSYFESLEKKRYELFEELEKINNQKLNLKPNPDKWSIIQVMHHLIKSEQLSVIYIKRKISNKSLLENSNIKSKINAFALKWGLNLPLKFKAPTNVSDVPDLDTFENVKLKWDKVRNSFSSIINDTSTEVLTKNIFRHPIAGRMNMIGTIEFFDSHFKHHHKQIKALLNKLNSEKK